MYGIRHLGGSHALSWPFPSSENRENLRTPLFVSSVCGLSLSLLTLCWSVRSICLSVCLVLGPFLWVLCLFLFDPVWLVGSCSLSLSESVSPHVFLHISLYMRCHSLSLAFLLLLAVFSGVHIPERFSTRLSSPVPASTLGCPSQFAVWSCPASCQWVTLRLCLWLLCGQAGDSQLLCCPDPSQSTESEARRSVALIGIQGRSPRPSGRAVCMYVHTHIDHTLTLRCKHPLT